MALPRPERLAQGSFAPAAGGTPGIESGRGGNGGGRVAALRRVERKRRHVQRTYPRGVIVPTEWLARITYSSFKLENLSITERDVAEALSSGAGRRALRPPQLLRIRNHVAILRHVQRSAARGGPLKLSMVVRWYTSISCGLSMGVDLARVGRIEQYLRRINSPQLRLQQAIADVSQVYTQLTVDPIFPGFNGILARLLLQYHLARCGLPLVVLDGDVKGCDAEDALQGRIMGMVSDAYEVLLRP